MYQQNELTIVYIGDQRIVKPLSVSVFALLSNLRSDFPVSIHILQTGWSSRDKKTLGIAQRGFGGRLQFFFHEIDLSPYVHLPKFGGSHHCYALLHATNYVKSPRLLCLDYDTLPLLDVSELATMDLAGNSCGAVCWNETAGSAQEAELFNEIGLPKKTPVLNSGVLVIDRNKWEVNQTSESCMNIAVDAGSQIVGDQTVINAVLAGRFLQLPWKYNVRLGHRAPKYDGAGIAHFVGSPKPWAFTGHWRHGNYHLWAKWLKAFKGQS